jgi:peptide deformylase
MDIYTIHQSKEEKVLRTKTEKFDFAKFNKKDIRELVRAMRLIMAQANGVGLAANQVGLSTSMFVAQCEGKFYAVFNPEVTKVSKEKTLLEEGCLSVPGMFGEIERADKITLEGQDQNGKKIKIKAWGLLAQIFQHETDHLSGKLYIDRAKGVHKVETIYQHE